jgi:hypothetical protein
MHFCSAKVITRICRTLIDWAGFSLPPVPALSSFPGFDLALPFPASLSLDLGAIGASFTAERKMMAQAHAVSAEKQ